MNADLPGRARRPGSATPMPCLLAQRLLAQPVPVLLMIESEFRQAGVDTGELNVDASPRNPGTIGNVIVHMRAFIIVFGLLVAACSTGTASRLSATRLRARTPK
jgi:hypothetical protein